MNARVAPDAAIKSKRKKHRNLKRHHPGKRFDHGIKVKLRDFEIETEPERDAPRGKRDDQVMAECGKRVFVAQDHWRSPS